MRTRLALLLPVAFSVSMVFAQNPSQTPGEASDKIETPHLTVTTSVGPAAQGMRRSLFVDVTPKPKMHVYSPEQKDYIAIALTLAPNPAVKPQPAVYPKPEKFFFEPLQETQLVYSKPFRIVQEVALGKRPDGPFTLKGTLRYQACDDKVCYLPKELTLTWTVVN